jgi:hypothetical protein
MILPTALEVRSWSRLDFGSLNFSVDADLDRLIVRAEASFRRITGLRLTEVPGEDVPLVQQAIQGMTEQLAFQAQPEILETLSDFDLLSSFSAGAYSEQRRSPREMFEARMVNPWPWLNAALWGLMTPEREEYWTNFFTGGNAPAFAVSEVNWGGSDVDSSYIWGA